MQSVCEANKVYIVSKQEYLTALHSGSTQEIEEKRFTYELAAKELKQARIETEAEVLRVLRGEVFLDDDQRIQEPNVVSIKTKGRKTA